VSRNAAGGKMRSGGQGRAADTKGGARMCACGKTIAKQVEDKTIGLESSTLQTDCLNV